MAIRPLWQQIRWRGWNPDFLSLEPQDERELRLSPDVVRSLTHLFGINGNTSYAVGATQGQALKVSPIDSGLRQYSIKAGTAPASFDTTNRIALSVEAYQFDILVESQEAEIRFINSGTGFTGTAIPLTVGYHSIHFTATEIDIQKRGATAGTYTLIAFYE